MQFLSFPNHISSFQETDIAGGSPTGQGRHPIDAENVINSTEEKLEEMLYQATVLNRLL